MSKNLFKDANLYQTRGIADACKDDKFKTEVIIAMGRFFAQDWGEICEEDEGINEECIPYLDRILGVYETSKGKIWISGESHEGKIYDTVVVLFPDEY